MLNASFRLLPKRTLRAAAVAAAVAVAAAGLVGCSSNGGGSAGSATKGTVNWWGWTPELATAKSYMQNNLGASTTKTAPSTSKPELATRIQDPVMTEIAPSSDVPSTSATASSASSLPYTLPPGDE